MNPLTPSGSGRDTPELEQVCEIIVIINLEKRKFVRIYTHFYSRHQQNIAKVRLSSWLKHLLPKLTQQKLSQAERAFKEFLMNFLVEKLTELRGNSCWVAQPYFLQPNYPLGLLTIQKRSKFLRTSMSIKKHILASFVVAHLG